MSIRFSNVLFIACLLSMSLIFSPTNYGDHNNTGGPQSVFANAYCAEGERYQGVHIYTVHKADAQARSNMLNDLGDYNSGWYAASATVIDTDTVANYYSGKINKIAYEEELYEQSPGEVSGNGSADSYIYGVGCVDTASDESNYDEPYY